MARWMHRREHQFLCPARCCACMIWLSRPDVRRSRAEPTVRAGACPPRASIFLLSIAVLDSHLARAGPFTYMEAHSPLQVKRHSPQPTGMRRARDSASARRWTRARDARGHDVPWTRGVTTHQRACPCAGREERATARN